MVQTGVSSALPVAFALVSNEDADAFVALFTVLLHRGSGVFPRYIMSDDSATIDQAIRRVFANSELERDKITRHLLCIWHSNTNILRLTKKDAPLARGGRLMVNDAERKAIYHDVKFLACATSEQLYNDSYRRFKNKYRDLKFQKFVEYVDKNYHHYRHKWSRAFRDLDAPMTNNVLESTLRLDTRKTSSTYPCLLFFSRRLAQQS